MATNQWVRRGLLDTGKEWGTVKAPLAVGTDGAGVGAGLGFERSRQWGMWRRWELRLIQDKLGDAAGAEDSIKTATAVLR